MKALAILAVLAGVAEAGSHCHETSPIVGRQRCGSFGSRWAHQALFGLFGYEVGLVLDRVTVPALAETGSVYNARGTAGYHATSPRAAMTALGVRQRFGYRGVHTLIGFEMSGAWSLDAPPLTTVVDGEGALTTHGGVVFDAELVTGLHARLGPVELGTELGAGVRALTLTATLPDGYTRCTGGGTGKSCGYGVSDAAPLVDARVRLDAWVDPQLTIGLSAGLDLVNRGQTFVLTLGYHGVVFDGQ